MFSRALILLFSLRRKGMERRGSDHYGHRKEEGPRGWGRGDNCYEREEKRKDEGGAR